MKARAVLMLPMQRNDSGARTVGGYLQALVRAVWEQEVSFSGKRPFGNSGWSRDLQRAVIAGGASTGTLDSQGYVKDLGDTDDVIFDAIDALFPEPWAEEHAMKIAGIVLRVSADELDPPATQSES